MITASKIIGSGIDYKTYSRQPDGVKRGHPDFIMSRSELVEFADCPAKWLASKKKDKGTKAQEWGNLIDCLVITPEKFDSIYSVTPLTYPCEPTKKDSRTEKPWHKSTYCDAWEAEQEYVGLIVIDHKLKALATLAVRAIEDDPDLFSLLTCCQRQVMISGTWEDQLTGIKIPIRCLIDLLPASDHPRFSKWICDLKTARNGNPKQWDRVVDDGAYDVQCALSMDLHSAATKEDKTDWIFPISENTEPYHVVKPLIGLTSEFIGWGRKKYTDALRYYAQCLQKNEWPSYATAGLLVAGGLIQLIGPENLYTYRKTAGEGARMEDRYPANEPVKDRADEMAEVVP